ncbi:MAG TPA: phosphatase PAP2 family protein [Sphingomicrobium sp.]|nr:phosphatase PAP2 family protein [Sphingomicrobium sp.]
MSHSLDLDAAKLRHLGGLILLACTWLAMLLLGRDFLDRSVSGALYAGGHPSLIVIARVLTALGEPTVLVTAGFALAFCLLLGGRGRFALGLLLVILIGRGLSEVQKYWIGRPRPDIDPHLVAVNTPSFPSGHATSSMIFYLTVALALVPKGRLRPIAVAGALLLSFLIGISRVMLGVHWSSDVIGGWSFGLFWVTLTLGPAERRFGPNSRFAPKQL